MLLPNSEPAWAAVLEEGGWWVDAGGRQELSAASPPLCGITNEGRNARELGVSGDVEPLAPRAASGALCGAPGQEGPGGFVVLLGLQAPFGVGQEEHGCIPVWKATGPGRVCLFMVRKTQCCKVQTL